MLVWDRRLAIVAVASVLVAWAIGWYQHDLEISPYLHQALAGASQFEETRAGIIAGRSTEKARTRTIGYVTFGQADGYGGPMRVAVAVDLSGTVVGSSVIEHHETTAYYRRVVGARIEENLVGKIYSDPFGIGQDVDAVTGATMTVNALAGAVRAGARHVAGGQLNLPVPPTPAPSIKIGIPEIVLMALFGIALANYFGRFRRKKLIRWASLVIALVIIGFAYNGPITLTNVNSFLLGFWPQWQTHIYWYLLVSGVLLIPLTIGRNPYCRSICPFGGAQECLGALGNSRPRMAPKYRSMLRWLPRGLAWGGIVFALIYRNPAKGNYEVYGGLFDVIGTQFQFGLLAAVLVASLFVTRPWCNYLCPIRAITDFLRFLRRNLLRRKRGVGHFRR